MQMIPGLDRSPQSKGSTRNRNTETVQDAARTLREAEAAKAAIEQLNETYEKLTFEKDFMVDWYERKTNQRLEPEQIVRNVLGGQAYQEYIATMKKIKLISEKLSELNGSRDK